MLGDSDQDLLDLDGDEEDEQLPDSSQELQRLRIAEIRRRLAQNRKLPSPQDERPAFAPDEDAGADLPPSSQSSLPPLPPLPPYPTALSQPGGQTAEMPPSHLPRTIPLPELPASTDDTNPSELMESPGSVRRRATQSFSAPYTSINATPEQEASRAEGASLRGWQSFRRQSPWLVPLVFVVFFFFLVLAIKPASAGPLLFIFAAIGVLQAVVLLYAAMDVLWVLAVISGFVVMAAMTFFVFFQVFFAILLSILLLAVGVAALRERYYPIKDGTVAVMGLFGKYNRTLQPGFNLRIPGEKLLGLVETHQMRYDLRSLALSLESGEQVVVDVALSYQVVPGEEYLAIRNTQDWREPIHEQLLAAVQDVVSILSADDFRPRSATNPTQKMAKDASPGLGSDEQEYHPLKRINDLLTSSMRELVADRGVAVHTVRLVLREEPRLPGQAHGGRPAPPMAHPAPGYPPAPPPTTLFPPGGRRTETSAGPLPPLVFPGQALPLPSATPVSPPARGGGALPAAGSSPAPVVISPQALAETYDAVLRRRITDLATIRRIVAQFEAVANDPVLSEQVPFDAAAGARNLLHHLLQLEMQGASQLQRPQAGDATPAVPPLPEEQ